MAQISYWLEEDSNQLGIQAQPVELCEIPSKTDMRRQLLVSERLVFQCGDHGDVDG